MMDTRSLLLRKKKLLLHLYMVKQKKERRFWVRKIHSEREMKGEYCLLIKDLKLFDQEYFFRQFRMSPSVFELLPSMIQADKVMEVYMQTVLFGMLSN